MGVNAKKKKGGEEEGAGDQGMGKITLTDENGDVAHVTIADVKQSNGVIHVVDKVLLPKM